MAKPLRILMVQFGPIGDALMALALFDDILTLGPQATLLIITRRNAGLLRDLASAYPQVEVREIPNGIRSIPFFLSLLTKQWTLLMLGVALNYSFRLKLFFFALSVIPGNCTIGLDDREKGKGWLPLQIAIKPDTSLPIIQNFRRLISYIGAFDTTVLATRAPHVRLACGKPHDFSYAPGSYIVVHLFGMALWRTLPQRRWKTLFKKINDAYPDLPIVFTGSSKDCAMLEDIANTIPNARVCIDLPILEVAGIIDAAALYIGVDTGITHLAGVLQQKSVIITHLADPRWRPEYNPNARILVNSKRCTCGTPEECYAEEDGVLYRRCLYDITDEAVLAAVRFALSTPDRHVSAFAGLADENQALRQSPSL
ncbi:MAG: glycosyltransferase family 9 protein [Candidatus Pacebacteria bacterium]|nr:glycosyltransferase family 9 protein [Candidatus Paceibacterota bacterium]